MSSFCARFKLCCTACISDFDQRSSGQTVSQCHLCSFLFGQTRYSHATSIFCQEVTLYYTIFCRCMLVCIFELIVWVFIIRHVSSWNIGHVHTTLSCSRHCRNLQCQNSPRILVGFTTPIWRKHHKIKIIKPCWDQTIHNWRGILGQEPFLLEDECWALLKLNNFVIAY